MPSLGVPEIMILLVVALVVFGPRRLPELGRSLGHGIREFRRSTQGLKDEFGGVVGGAVNGPSPAAPVTPAAVSRPADSVPVSPGQEPVRNTDPV